MDMKTEHLGWIIRYDEDKGEWYSGHFRGKQLKAVKALIQKQDADERRIDGLPAIWLRSYRAEEHVKITLVADDRRQVWIAANSGREKVSLSELVRDTPENMAKLAETKALHAEADRLLGNAKTIRGKMQGFTVAELLDRERPMEAAE